MGGSGYLAIKILDVKIQDGGRDRSPCDAVFVTEGVSTASEGVGPPAAGQVSGTCPGEGQVSGTCQDSSAPSPDSVRPREKVPPWRRARTARLSRPERRVEVRSTPTPSSSTSTDTRPVGPEPRSVTRTWTEEARA